MLPPGKPLVDTAPYCAPHHSATMQSLVGGGKGIARPGAVSLAHRGVLFLDEAPEFSAQALDSLRQPLESGHVVIARSAGVVRLPAKFLMVLAANPCPCGRHTLLGDGCECPPSADPPLPGAALGPAARQGRPEGGGGAGHALRARRARRRGASPRRRSPTGCARRGSGRRPGWPDTGWRTNSEVPGHALRTRWPAEPGALDAAELDLERGFLTARGTGPGAAGRLDRRGPRGTRPARRAGRRPGAAAAYGGAAGRADGDRGADMTGVKADWRRPRQEERLARVALTRMLEPGDEAGGRWLREAGAVEVVRRFGRGGGAAGGVTPARWEGLRARAAKARPERDLAVARDAGVRFVCPGEAEWPVQLDDLGDARPVGLWVRGRPDLRIWALRSVAVVGARACTQYGAHMAAEARRRARRAGLGGRVGRRLRRGRSRAPGGAGGRRGHGRRARLRGRPGLSARPRRVDPEDRGTGSGGGGVAARGPSDAEQIHPAQPGDRRSDPGDASSWRPRTAAVRSPRARSARELGRFTMGVPGPATSGLSAGVHELLRG